MQKPTAILFDWDGTLADTMPVLTNAFNAVRAHYAMPLIDVAEARRISGLAKDQVFKAVTNYQVDSAEEQHAQNLFYTYIRTNHVADFVLLPGAANLIDFLQQQKIPTGVVTNKSREFFTAECALLGWQNIFAATCCPDEAPNNKPAPDAAWHCLQLMQHAPSPNIWFVGDTQGDVDCANQAGLTSVLITHGQPHTIVGAALEFQDLSQLQNYLLKL